MLQYQYNKDGKRSQVTYPSGRIISLTYDNDGRPDLIKDNGTTLADYDYDPLGRLAVKAFPGISAEAQYQFDIANQLTLLTNRFTTGGGISQYAYPDYDNAGNRTTMQRIPAVGSPETTHYAYNNIYELTQVTGNQVHSFSYDNVGNRTTADGVMYTPNNLNQYSAVAGINFTYDGNGNLASDGTRSLAYDEENHLTTTTGASYAYDALGRRTSKTVISATAYYIHDGDSVIAEYSGENALLAEYIEGSSIDDHLVMDRNGNRYYYLQDGLGSVSEVLSSSGSIAESYTYDVYGKPSVINSTIGNPYRFTGRAFDEETGLYDYRHRIYSSQLGSFLQRDPIGAIADINLYRYVQNRPTMLVDYDGRFGIPTAILGAISGGVGGAITGFQAGMLEEHKSPASIALSTLLGGTIGAGVGGLLGLVTPTGINNVVTNIAVKASLGATASLAGQISGNMINMRGYSDNISPLAIYGSAFGSGAGGLLESILEGTNPYGLSVLTGAYNSVFEASGSAIDSLNPKNDKNKGSDVSSCGGK